MQGRGEKFQYLLSDGSMRVMDIDGDEFAEADYGLIVDNGTGAQDLSQKLDMLAQAALQNQTISFSTIMKLYSSVSLIEKQRLVEKDERAIQERQAQMQQQQLQAQQEQAQLVAQQKQAEMEQREQANIRDNETKIMVAQISANAHVDDGIEEPEYSQEAKDRLAESMRQFDAKLALDRDKLALEKRKADMDYDIRERQLKNKTVSTK